MRASVSNPVTGASRRRAAAPSPRVSTAEKPFPADLAAAQRYAASTLRAIDFSKRDLVIWVQGSGNHGMHPVFEEEALTRWSARGTMSLSYLRYTAGRDMRPSVATGIATLKLVLAGIAAHGGDHRVLLAGDSQGAWVLGEAAADPRLRAVITRAVMLGHPSLALHHAPADPAGTIVEVNKPADPVAMPMRGSQDAAVDAYTAIYLLQLHRLPTILHTMLRNPRHAVNLVRSWLSFVPGLRIANPHGYNELMPAVIDFLDTGNNAALTQAIQGAAVLGPLPPG